MKYFVDGAFYDQGITPEIPEGAVELTDEEWQELLEQQSAGKVITTGEDGNPVVSDPPPPSAEEQAKWAAEELYQTLQKRSVMQSIPIDDDATAITLAPICPEWQAGTHYEAGEIVNRKGQPYRVVQAVDSLEHQSPDADGMLAIYRPLNTENSGTVDDPIPYVSGMDVYNGKYYSFNGNVYLCKQDMTPCVWDPGTAGVWQWELQGAAAE